MRQPLPPRRPAVTRQIDWQGHQITLSIGFCPMTGVAREVFADTLKGGQMSATVADACVWASLLLQIGAHPRDLVKSLASIPAPDWAGPGALPASPLGAIGALLLDEILQDDAEANR